MMSVETIRMALGRLQDDPENEAAWNELAEAVTAPGVSNAEVERLLGAARARSEARRRSRAVAARPHRAATRLGRGRASPGSRDIVRRGLAGGRADAGGARPRLPRGGPGRR